MFQIRKRQERGRFDFGWLNTYHSFSFDQYYDPAYMGFRQLRVLNEDRVEPGGGFPTHPHRDMEIITYVLEGALEHKDSMGNGSIIRPGDVQRMSAGTGITHSEFNPSRKEGVHLLQIWILPDARGLPPSYEQKTYGDDEKRGRLRLIASRDARDESVKIHQDAAVYAGVLNGDRVVHTLGAGRHAWVQVARGAVTANGQELMAGDGAAVSGEAAVELASAGGGEVLVFDLA